MYDKLIKDSETLICIIEKIEQVIKENSIRSEQEAYEVCYADQRIDECIKYLDLTYDMHVSKEVYDLDIASQLLKLKNELKESKKKIHKLRKSLDHCVLKAECNGTEMDILKEFTPLEYSTRIGRKSNEDKLSVNIVDTLGYDELGLRSEMFKKLPQLVVSAIMYNLILWLMNEQVNLPHTVILITNAILLIPVVVMIAKCIVMLLFEICPKVGVRIYKLPQGKDYITCILHIQNNSEALVTEECIYTYRPKKLYGENLLYAIFAKHKAMHKEISHIERYFATLNKSSIEYLDFVARLEIIAESYNMRGLEGLREYNLLEEIAKYAK